MSVPPASESDFFANRNPLVGRGTEKKELRAGLADAVTGHGRIFLLSGDPGIGKSRLADDLSTEASSYGAQAVWAACDAPEAQAYWPWIQVVRSCLRRSGLQATPPLAGSDVIWSLVPELRPVSETDHSGIVAPPDASIIAAEARAPELERFRLFDSIVNFLRNLATAAPLLIVLDDVHAADADSLLLLRFVSRNLRSAHIMLLATYRETEVRASQRVADVVGDLQREASYIPLRGLSEIETEEFIQRAAGWLPAPRTVSAIFQATDGNPFFLSQIVRLLIAEGRLQRAEPSLLETLNIPDGVRNTIRRRLDLLAQPVKECLQLASVVGRDFEFGVVRSLSGLPEEPLLTSLEAAIDAGLVSRVAGWLNRYRFSHFLIRETLYGDQPISVRKALHLKIAQTLERLYLESTKSHLSILAYHYAQAIPFAPLDKVFAYSRDAAIEAMAIHAYDEAVRLYSAAVEALQPRDPGAERSRFETMLSLGNALHGAGYFHQCRLIFEQAAEIARRLKSPRDLARAALGRASPITETGVIDEALISLLEEALSALGDEDERFRAMLMARLSWEIYWNPDRERRISLARSAIAMARRLGDIPALTFVLYYTLLALWTPDNLNERLETTDEIVRLTEESSKYESLRAHYLRFVYLLELGDIQSAREEIETCRDLIDKIRQPYGALEMCQASLAFLEGRFSEGLQFAARAMTIAENLEGRAGHFRQTYYSFEFLLRTERGQIADLEQMVKGLVSHSDKAPFRSAAPAVARCVLALIYCDKGRIEDAAAEFEALAVDDFGYLPKDMAWLSALVLLSEVCVRLGDRDRAVALYSALAPYASRNSLLTWHVCYGPVSYYLGMLAAMMGRLDESEAHFQAALSLNRQMGAHSWMAHTQYQYASMLSERARGKDRESALTLLQRCRETASALDMTSLEKSILTLFALGEEANATGVKTSDATAKIFVREGDFWTISHRGKVFRLKNIKGVGYLAHLLSHPGVEFHALDLTAALGLGETGTGTSERQRLGITDKQLAEAGLRVGSPTDAGEMLDAEAKKAYKLRVIELRDQLEDAKELGNTERQAKIQDEIDAVARELSRAVGLGGRDRRAASTAERARVSVTQAIKAAIERIAKNDPELGRMLARTIRTGNFCSYVPDSHRQPT